MIYEALCSATIALEAHEESRTSNSSIHHETPGTSHAKDKKHASHTNSKPATIPPGLTIHTTTEFPDNNEQSLPESKLPGHPLPGHYPEGLDVT
jgi:hypothetical protein